MANRKPTTIANPPASDAALIELGRVRAALISRSDQAITGGAADLQGIALAGVDDAAYEKLHATEMQILGTPAETLTGLRVKVQILADEQLASVGDTIPPLADCYSVGPDMDWEWGLAFSIYADVMRLAGEADAEILELKADRDVLVKGGTADETDAETDARGDKIIDLERRIMATPATTARGLLVKLSLLADYTTGGDGAPRRGLDDTALYGGLHPDPQHAAGDGLQDLGCHALDSIYADLRRLAGGEG